jgi:brefeldin A-inhibited guanine nucleotide-exchange protein
MSIQGFGEALMRALERISSLCKDKHHYVKACCDYTVKMIKDDPMLEKLSPEERANLFFYPLKISVETQEDHFAALALDAIQKLLAHGFIDASVIYRSPDVPVPQRRKTFFSSSKDEFNPAKTPKSEKEQNEPLAFIIIKTICSAVSSVSEEVQLMVVRALLTIVSTTKCEIHGSHLLQCIRTTYHVYLQAKQVPPQSSAKSSLSQMIGTVQLKMENESSSGDKFSLCDSVDSTSNADSDTGEHDPVSFDSENERDCFLILRALCKLSQRGNADGVVNDTAEVRSKVISLTLIHHFICNVGPRFACKPSFALAVHKYLCVCLLQSSTSTVHEIAKMSMNILLRLLVDFRHIVRSKVAVFCLNVLFPVLESPNASFNHRSSILSLFESFFQDSQAVVDLFVNFDCQVGAPNIYEELINRISKVVQTSHVVPNWVSPFQEEKMKLQAVRGLRNLVDSLSSWIVQQEAFRGDEHPPDEEAELTASESSVEKMIKGKRSYEAVLEVFNSKKAKEGIMFAVQTGWLKSDDPKDIAAFLLSKGLDKIKIGEYLSGNNPHTKEVLRCFINLHDFTGLEIDEAMRVFLGKFKIYGEAETVDRTMEQFAERYCAQNPDAFSSPGTAYVLAFSIMMLNTDAHSVNIKTKMTLEEFIRNNRGIDDGKDLPASLMTAIYQRITSREIKLEGDTQSSKAASSPVRKKGAEEDDKIFVSLEKKKQMNYRSEADVLVQQTMQLLSTGSADASFEYVTGHNPEVAMWDTTWTSVLPALSVPMEESDNEEMIDACLEGFDKAMIINCKFSLATERKAFLSSLLAFTHLTSLREMHYKNVRSITTLIRIAAREGDHLESSWYEILQCISWLDKLHLVGGKQHTRVGSEGNNSFAQKSAVELKKMEIHNAEVVARDVDQVAVDMIFSKSGSLSGQAVVDLVQALCTVSAQELQEQPRPRTYSLQKLVEVAEINIGRLRYVWSKMWVHLSRHFISVGLDKQQLVAMFVVDSLRQLAMKFLQRDELGNFNFQRDFLKPFEVIASQTTRPEIRELVVASLNQMVDSRADNIMSGWKIVIATLGKCGSDTSATVVNAASTVLAHVTSTYMYLVLAADLFTEIVNAWSMFAGNTSFDSIACQAVDYIHLVSAYVRLGVFPSRQLHGASDDRVLAMREADSIINALHAAAPHSTVPLTFHSEADHMRLWLSIFAALSSLSTSGSRCVREKALDMLYTCVLENGDQFSRNDQWQMVLGGTLFPIFDNVLCDLNILLQEESPQASEEYEFELGLLKQAMQMSVKLFMALFDQLQHLLYDFLTAIGRCTRRDDALVVNIGFINMLELVGSMSKSERMSSDHWATFTRFSNELFQENARGISDFFSRPASVVDAPPSTYISAQSNLVSTLGKCLKLEHIPSESAVVFMGLFRSSFDTVAEILHNPQCIGLLDCFSEPSVSASVWSLLLHLERESCMAYLGAIPFAAQEEQRVATYQWSKKVMALYVNSAACLENRTKTEESEVLLYVVNAILRTLAVAEDPRFVSMVNMCYDEFCDLVSLGDKGCSDELAVVFRRIKQTLLFPRER